MEDTVDEKLQKGECSETLVFMVKNRMLTNLDCGIGDTNGIEHPVEVVRYEAISGPLGEEGQCKNDAHALSVSRS